MASSTQPSANAGSTKGKTKMSKAQMSIPTLLNRTVSQLPTPDVSPNQEPIDDFPETSSNTQAIPDAVPNRDQDYLLLPAPQTGPSTPSLPSLFAQQRGDSPSLAQVVSSSRPQVASPPQPQTATPSHSPETSRSFSTPASYSESSHVEGTRHRALPQFIPARSSRARQSPTVENEMPDQWVQTLRLGPVNRDEPNGPREAILQLHTWDYAARYPRQYGEMVARTNYWTYASGQAPRLNMLADIVCTQAEQQNGTYSRRRPAPSSRIAQQTRRPGQDLSEPPSVTARSTSSRTESSRVAAAQPSTSTTVSPRGTASRSTRGRRRESEDGGAPPAKRQRSEPQKKTKPKSYEDVIDYCPDISTEGKLCARPNVESRHNAIDLSNEPPHLLAMMTDFEVNLASNLRLDCNNYLINKRLIFKGKVDHRIKGREFSKTHAQQYGVIDVNKSSLLWEYYHSAGWLEPEAMAKFVTMEKRRREKLNGLEEAPSTSNSSAVDAAHS